MEEVNTHDPFNLVGRKHAEKRDEPKPKRNYVRRAPPAPRDKETPRHIAEPKVDSTLVAANYSTGELMIRAGGLEILLTATQRQELLGFLGVQTSSDSPVVGQLRARRVCKECKSRRSVAHFRGGSTVCQYCEGMNQ
jgi:hypothetical protein